jgi:transcriptional regulator with XRE-family HTH domain
MATHRRKHPAPAQFRQRLEQILEFHGITQADLARRVGIKPSAINQWMSGSVMPSDDNAARAAGALGEDLEYFMARIDRGTTGLGKVQGELLDKAGPDGITFLASLPGDELRRLIAALQASKATPKPGRKKS